MTEAEISIALGSSRSKTAKRIVLLRRMEVIAGLHRTVKARRKRKAGKGGLL